MKSIEKHSFKISLGIATIVIIFLITTSMNFATWKTQKEAEHLTLETGQEHLIENCKESVARITILESRLNEVDVNNAEIKTKLISIEALLLDLKADMKAFELREIEHE